MRLKGSFAVSALTLLSVMIVTLFLAAPVFAQLQLGGQPVVGTLRVDVYDTGRIGLYRYTGSTWQNQVYGGSSKGSKLYINGTMYGLSGNYYNGTQMTSIENTLVDSTHIRSIWQTGLVQVQQDTYYPAGASYVRYQWNITNNTGGGLTNLRYFQGQDTYLAGGDNGAGFWDASTNSIGVTKTVTGVQQRQTLQGVTIPFNHESQYYYSVRTNINNNALTGTIDPNESTDNGYALEWRTDSLAAGATWTIDAYEKFGNAQVTNLSVTAPVSGVIAAGGSVDLSYSVRNLTGSSTSVTATSASASRAGWTATVQTPATPFNIGAGATQAVVVRVTAPGGEPLNTTCNVMLTVTDASGIASDTVTVTVNSVSANVAPTITSQNHAEFNTCGLQSFQVSATGTPATFTYSVSAGSLPPGVTLDASTGLLSGWPTLVGSYDFTLTVDNGVSPAATQSFTLAVLGAACYQLSPSSVSLNSVGGTFNVSVISLGGCGWTATSDSSWINVVSSICQDGIGVLTYRVDPNNGPARSGSILIGKARFSINQPTDMAEFFIPSVLASTGMNGAYYSSELILTNRGNREASVDLTYTEALQPGWSGGTVSLNLLAGQQLIEPDAIAFLKRLGLPLGDGNHGGTLRVMFSSLANPTDAAVLVRTSSILKNGKAGLSYNGVLTNQTLDSPAYVCGLRQNDLDRSHLALGNAGTAIQGDVTLRVKIYSSEGLMLAVIPDVTLPFNGFTQINEVLHSQNLTLASGYVRVERVAGNAPYYAYGIINDNKNSDGSFVPPQADIVFDSLSPRSLWTLPVLIESGEYSSELVVTNWSSEPRQLNLQYVAAGLQSADRTARIVLSLTPGEQMIIPDVIQTWRQQGIDGIGPSGGTLAGALFILPSGDRNGGLFIGARTSTVAPANQGQFGVFYSAIPGARADFDKAVLIGLRQDDENRTNLAIVNTGEYDSTSSEFTVDLYNGATGQLAASVAIPALQAKGWVQINNILAQKAPGVAQAYAQVRRTSGSNPFVAYAIVNDGGQPGQRTDDGSYISMIPDLP